MEVLQQDNKKDTELSREDELLEAIANICFDKWMIKKQKLKPATPKVKGKNDNNLI